MIVIVLVLQEEVPPGIYYAHYKNVEKNAVDGKFDPNLGLDVSGIAGTGTDKEDEDKATPASSAATDEELKDTPKKDIRKLNTWFFFI